VVLYEIVVGAPPFEAPNYNALIRSILRDKPTPMTARAAGDQQLWTIVERCLRKDREQRWASMWELGEALALWAFERGVRVDAAARSLKHGWLEGGITGLQILVNSEHPDPPTWPPEAMPSAARPVDSSVEPGALARTQVRPTRKRFPKGAVAFFAVSMLGLGLALAWSQRGRLLPQAPQTPLKSAAQLSTVPLAEVPAVQAVPSAAMPEPASPSAVPEAAQPAASASAPSAAVSGSPVASPRGQRAGTARKSAPAAAARASAAPSPAAPARPRGAKAANTEFGF
jgi:serine/threonine-protein kinase